METFHLFILYSDSSVHPDSQRESRLSHSQLSWPIANWSSKCRRRSKHQLLHFSGRCAIGAVLARTRATVQICRPSLIDLPVVEGRFAEFSTNIYIYMVLVCLSLFPFQYRRFLHKKYWNTSLCCNCMCASNAGIPLPILDKSSSTPALKQSPSSSRGESIACPLGPPHRRTS